MRTFVTVSALLLLLSGNALAGSEYDKCIKEEKALKIQEARDCSGLSYLLNPSGCFATQKALRNSVSTGKCKNISVAENIDFSSPSVGPAKKSGTAVKDSAPEESQQESLCEQLKDENERLKAEISRLRAENGQLRKASP